MDSELLPPLSAMEGLLAETSVEMLVSLLNIAGLSYLFIRMRTTKMIHKNLRMLLLNIAIALGVFNTARFWNDIIFFTTLFLKPASQQSGFQDFLIYQCWFVRAIYDTTINMFSISMFIMGIERIVATAAVKTYEQNESFTVALVLVTSQWVLSVTGTLVFLIQDGAFKRSSSFDDYNFSCSLIYTHPVLLSFIFLAGVIGFFSFGLALFLLYKYNSREYSKIGCSLTIRYQMAENITTLRFLVPIVVSFGCLFAASFVIVLYIASEVRSHGRTNQLVGQLFVYEQLYNLLGIVFTVSFVVFCLLLHRPLRSTLMEDLGSLGRHPKNAADNRYHKIANKPHNGCETDIHFATLQANWNQKD